MLRRVAFTELSRDPQTVRLLHHTRGGVVIAAVAHRPAHTAHAASNPSAAGTAPLFFTVVEMPAPNECGLPLRVVRVRVPRPATRVNAISLIRSPDGEEVFVVVQAVEETAQSRGAVLKSVATYVYRRQLVAATGQGENEEEEGSNTAEVLSGGETELRVRYQRLPRTVSGADGPLWTATASFSPAEVPIFGRPTTAASSDTLALLTASCTTATDAEAAATTQLQLWSLSGTRLSLVATCRLPALTGFAVEEVLTVPGTQNVAILRCHNALLEVDLAGLRLECTRYPHTVTTDAVLTRGWRLSPHAALTACAMKDAMLYAGTEDGRVLLWDYRTTTAAAPQSSASFKAPITGLYAPYATGFVSCDASGGVREWRDRADVAEEEEAQEGSAAAAERHTGNEEDEKGAGRGVLRDLAGQAAAAAAAASLFPYCPCAPVEVPGGAEGCVAMDGHDNFAAVVSESGLLSVYFCS